MTPWHSPLSKKHQLRGKDKPSKYRAVRTHCGKHAHMSKAEAECCGHFQMRERAGELVIEDSQPNVFLTLARLKVIPDWLIRYSDGRRVYADYKGAETKSWGRNRRLWKHYGPLPMEVWKKNNKGFFISEVIGGKTE